MESQAQTGAIGPEALHLCLPAATRPPRGLHGRKPWGHWMRQCLRDDLAGGLRNGIQKKARNYKDSKMTYRDGMDMILFIYIYVII